MRGAPLALALALGGCLAPPAVIETDDFDGARALERLPAGTETVELLVDDGEHLRGFFVPAGEGAPVVLHLVNSGSSVASGLLGLEDVTRELADLGWASLAVDYTGIGLSDGEPSIERLGRDAQAAWEEAQRRAGGPERVVLRGVSLGTLAAALLLDSGARPAGLVLLAPVRAGTATRRFARVVYGAPVSWLAGLVYRDLTDVELVDVLVPGAPPCVVVSSSEDFFLDGDELAELRAATEAAGGTFRDRRGGHILLTVESRWVLPEERALYADLHPVPSADPERSDALRERLEPERAAALADPAARERWERLVASTRGADDALLVAAAIHAPDAAAAIDLVRLWRRRGVPRATPEVLAAWFDVDDPGGPLPVDLIELASWPYDLALKRGGMCYLYSLDEVVFAARGPHPGQSAWSARVGAGSLEASVTFDADELLAALAARGLTGADLRRQHARILLAALRRPARVRRSAETGSTTLEVLVDEGWSELDVEGADLGDELDRGVFRGSIPRPFGGVGAARYRVGNASEDGGSITFLPE